MKKLTKKQGKAVSSLINTIMANRIIMETMRETEDYDLDTYTLFRNDYYQAVIDLEEIHGITLLIIDIARLSLTK